MPKKDADSFSEEKKEVLSEFNEAKFQILRLHDSYMRIKQYRRTGALIAWKWELDNVWDELSSKAEMNDKEKYFSEIEELDKAITDSSKNKDDLYQALRAKERYLRLIQEDVGMGGRFKDQDEEGVES